jgi:uncharacterized protein
VEFEWDRRKAISNLKTHGVDLADAVTVFDDDLAVTMPGEHPEEQRFITLGMDALGRVLVVVYGWRGDRIRIISARKATPRERRQYGG